MMKMTPSRLRLMTPEERRLFEEQEQLYKALGEFFLLWADVETELYRVLIHYAGVTDDIGRAIFSGCRARVMIDFLRNIAHNTKMDAVRANDLDYLCAQTNAINTIRDKIAHYGSVANTSVSHKTLKRSLSNYHRVSKRGAEFNEEISSLIVDDMCADLRRIYYRLSIHCRKDAPTDLGVDVPRDGPTWRYKPAQPNSPKSKNQKSPQAPQRQRKSSPK